MRVREKLKQYPKGTPSYESWHKDWNVLLEWLLFSLGMFGLSILGFCYLLYASIVLMLETGDLFNLYGLGVYACIIPILISLIFLHMFWDAYTTEWTR